MWKISRISFHQLIGVYAMGIIQLLIILDYRKDGCNMESLRMRHDLLFLSRLKVSICDVRARSKFIIMYFWLFSKFYMRVLCTYFITIHCNVFFKTRAIDTLDFKNGNISTTMNCFDAVFIPFLYSILPRWSNAVKLCSIYSPVCCNRE